jgi:glyoxylase-like metal-dependent hydrolase (beta-lactamase superfamily II)
MGMQEIAPHVFIENAYVGVTLAAINWSHGLLLIDSPFRADDVRAWRASLLNLSGGVDRLMINLDAHFDRTLGARAMDCTIIGHDKMAGVFRNRPTTFKTQSVESGAEWEQCNGLGSIRWVPPEITFTDQMIIYWDDSPLELNYRAGSSTGAIWARLPKQRILFLGDAVVPGQPPYLATGNLKEWLANLKMLLTPEYQDYILVSGRGGVVTMTQVHEQIRILEKIEKMVQEMAHKNAASEETASLVPALMKEYQTNPGNELQFQQRLRWGLNQYYLRHFGSGSEDDLEE